MTDKSDLELIALIKDGNEDAFEALYDRYASGLMGFVFKILQDEATAAEIVQETFIRIWERCDRYDAELGKFSTWMFGIGRNLAIDRYRKQQVRPKISQSEATTRKLEAKPANDPLVDEAIISQMQRETIIACVEELPDAQQKIIELSYFNGLTQREIAEQENIALGTVNSRARLALKKLSKALKEI